MSLYTKGGLPLILTGAASTSFVWWTWAQGPSNWIYFQNMDPLIPMTIAFSEADADAGKGIVIPPGLGTPGNPLSMPIEARGFYLKSASGTPTFNALITVRRG